ncbi:MAG: HAD family phosphatase [Phycisphaerales bacterium]|nr:MAG: HAD family phosphatase [Phycisphaerales bacterium]
MGLLSDIGVVFDMDGVLVDSAEPHFRSWQELAKENGVQVTREQFGSTFGRHNRDIIPLLFGSASEERLKALSERKEEIYRELIRDNAPIVPGAVELVRALHRAGAKLAVGSSGPRANIDLVLRAMEVDEILDAVVSADDVTRGKPDPQVFSLACARLGLDPARCVVVEDAPAGVEAGKAAGAAVVAVLMHHPAAALDGADLIVEKLSDLTVSDVVRLVS